MQPARVARTGAGSHFRALAGARQPRTSGATRGARRHTRAPMQSPAARRARPKLVGSVARTFWYPLSLPLSFMNLPYELELQPICCRNAVCVIWFVARWRCSPQTTNTIRNQIRTRVKTRPRARSVFWGWGARAARPRDAVAATHLDLAPDDVAALLLPCWRARVNVWWGSAMISLGEFAFPGKVFEGRARQKRQPVSNHTSRLCVPDFWRGTQSSSNSSGSVLWDGADFWKMGARPAVGAGVAEGVEACAASMVVERWREQATWVE